MPTNKLTYLGDLERFTVESMRWCALEAEREALNVSEIINTLTTDADRRASMSAVALEATRVVQAKIESALSA